MQTQDAELSVHRRFRRCAVSGHLGAKARVRFAPPFASIRAVTYYAEAQRRDQDSSAHADGPGVMNVRLPKFVHINGHLVSASGAHLGVFDRGLMYGDGVFETLRAYAGEPFGLDAHLKRLRTSAGFLGITMPRRPWRRDITALLQRNQLLKSDAWVRITVTRGIAPPALLPPRRARPTLIIAAGAVDAALREGQREGVRVVLLPFFRSGFLAEHKLLNYVPAVLGRVVAARHDAFEGLFVDADGLITEGTASNLFIWRHGQLLTPPLGGILPGLTRQLIIQAVTANGRRVDERPLTTQDLFDADEAFVTSSLVEVVPVVAVDKRPIGTGTVGPSTRDVQRLYQELVEHRGTPP